MGFPGGASGEEPTCQRRRHESQVRSLGGEDPLEGACLPTPAFLPVESHVKRSLTQSRASLRVEHDRSDLACMHMLT